jgi:hypothetical protein
MVPGLVFCEGCGVVWARAGIVNIAGRRIKMENAVRAREKRVEMHAKKHLVVVLVI